MRFSFAEAMCDPQHYVPLARAAEAAGWDSFVVPDSICYPKVSDSKYPYTPDGKREFLEDKPFIEPFVLASALAAVTERLRFVTFVVKLPIRHPVLVAKAAASIAVLAKDRFALGVGTSPWPEDFQVTGTDWKTRGKRTDEMIAIIRGLAKGGWFDWQGTHYTIPSIEICPVPRAPIPILVGGHTEPALRRAARLGDGWMHAGGDEDALDGYLERLAVLRREYGREGTPFELHVVSIHAYNQDGIRRLEDKGVTDVIVGFRDPYREPDIDLQEKIDRLSRYADDVIASVRGR